MLRLKVLVGALLAALVLSSVASSAVAAPDDAAVLAPEAPAKAVELMRVGRRMEANDRQVAVARQRLVSATAALQMTSDQITANQAQIDEVQRRVRAQALIAYEHSSTSRSAMLSVGNVDDLDSAQHYAKASLDVDNVQLQQLQRAEATLEQQRDENTAEHDHMASQLTQLSDDQQQLVNLQHTDIALLQRWGAVPVMGDAWLTATQLANWFRSTGAVAHLAPGTTIDDLTNLYIIEGEAEGVRGDLAFAQSMIETASFSVAAGNNYSGIGVCDSCTGGYGFATPLDGVRAQIQLLRNYADPDARAGVLSNPPSPDLYGADPRKAASTYDSFFLKGKAPLWNQMGNGNWATSTTYATSVISLFARMVAFVQAAPK